jgi:hypothetical protein
LQPAVQRLIQPPAPGTRKNWAAYRARFIDEQRISAGLRFWDAQRADLARAEREYGVPAEIIAGIIGVETLYGQHMGQFRVIDALATLAFDHPSEHPRLPERVAFFRSELEQFLTLAQRSFAFMPYMHSESALVHAQAVDLFSQPGMEDTLRFELRHKDIIDRFGRYPHRNALLGRTSTAEELAFLSEPGSGF